MNEKWFVRQLLARLCVAADLSVDYGLLAALRRARVCSRTHHDRDPSFGASQWWKLGLGV